MYVCMTEMDQFNVSFFLLVLAEKKIDERIKTSSGINNGGRILMTKLNMREKAEQ